MRGFRNEIVFASLVVSVSWRKKEKNRHPLIFVYARELATMQPSPG